MKKFVIYNGCILEVDCDDEYTYSWEVGKNEKKYRISLPLEIAGCLWMSWAFYEDEPSALVNMTNQFRKSMERDAKKAKTEFNEELFVETIANIKTKKLSDTPEKK